VSCEDILFSNPLIPAIRDLWMLLKANHLEGHQPLRVYANSHTYGVEGYLHVDNPDPLNYFTTVYYAHPVWDKNWAGETIFYQPDTDEVIAAVYPRPGRVVTFHGNIPHVARAPSRDCPEVRVCIVFKTQRVT
jgi:SM-20-related protein